MDSKNPLVEVAKAWWGVIIKTMSLYDDATVAIKKNPRASMVLEAMTGSFNVLMALDARLTRKGISLIALLSPVDQASLRVWILANGFGVVMWDIIKDSDVEADLRAMQNMAPSLREVFNEETFEKEVISEARRTFDDVRRAAEHRASQKRTPNSDQGQAVHAVEGARSDDARWSVVRAVAEEAEARIVEEVIRETFGNKARFFRLNPQGPCPICLQERGTLEHLIEKHRPSDLESVLNGTEKIN